MRLLLAALLLLPLSARAQSLKTFTDDIVGIVNTAVMPLLYALAILMFLVGMTRFFFLEGDEGREKGKSLMLWGVIGLAVLFSVWGIVNLFLTLLPGSAQP